MEGVVEFNVGGRLFSTRRATLDALHPDGLLSMLVRQKPQDSNSPIFIDRNPKLFRWILHLYQEPSTFNSLTHRTVGVEADVWARELIYYGLATEKKEEEEEEEDKKGRDETVHRQKREREEIEQWIGERLEKTCYHKDWKKSQSDQLDFARFLQTCIRHGYNLCFVDYDGVSPAAKTLDGIQWNLGWFSSRQHELKSYASKLGYALDIYHTSGDKSTRYEYPPASNANPYTRRLKNVIRISLKYKMHSDEALEKLAERRGW